MQKPQNVIALVGGAGDPGLIDQEQPRSHDERLGESDAGGLVRRELMSGCGAAVRSADALKHLMGSRGRLPHAGAVGQQREPNVVERCFATSYVPSFWDEADTAQALCALVSRQAPKIAAVEADDTGIRRLDAGGDAQERGLAGPRSTENREDLARPYVERDVLQPPDAAATEPVARAHSFE